MNKHEALDWLIKNVTTWPTLSGGITSRPEGWTWANLNNQMCLVGNIPGDMYDNWHIDKKEWADGMAAPVSVSNSDALVWLGNMFGHDVAIWPEGGSNYRESPNGWAWEGRGRHKSMVLTNRGRGFQFTKSDYERWLSSCLTEYPLIHSDKSNNKQADLKPTDGATKFDDDKPMMHLVPLISVEAVAKVMTFGAKKYAPDGWKSVPNAVDRYNSAMLRHMVAIQKGELVDPESGLPHIDHIACNAMFLSYFHNNGKS